MRAWILIAGYLGMLALLTVPRVPERWLLDLAQRLVSRVSGPHADETTRWVEPGLNVALFVPLAFLLCWGLPRLSRLVVWLLCALGSTGVELVQYLFLAGRHGSVRDVVTNSTGAAIGVLLNWAVTAPRRRRAGQSVRQQ